MINVSWMVEPKATSKKKKPTARSVDIARDPRSEPSSIITAGASWTLKALQVPPAQRQALSAVGIGTPGISQLLQLAYGGTCTESVKLVPDKEEMTQVKAPAQGCKFKATLVRTLRARASDLIVHATRLNSKGSRISGPWEVPLVVDKSLLQTAHDYHLHSVVVHTGQARSGYSSGHYTAYVRRDRQWSVVCYCRPTLCHCHVPLSNFHCIELARWLMDDLAEPKQVDIEEAMSIWNGENKLTAACTSFASWALHCLALMPRHLPAGLLFYSIRSAQRVADSDSDSDPSSDSDFD